MTRKNVLGIIVSIGTFVILLMVMGIISTFSHGFYCDEIDLDLVRTGLEETIDLKDSDYEMQFSPKKAHFAGFELFLVNQPEDNEGTLFLTVLDENGNQEDDVSVDLSKVVAETWYRVGVNVSLKKEKIYTLKFSAMDCVTVPSLQKIGDAYLGDETITGNLLIGYAYADSTFTFQNKVLIAMFLFAIWLLVCSRCIAKERIYKASVHLCMVVFLTALLAWNYMYNSMDSQNTSFGEFQSDSEAYVTGVIAAEQNGIWPEMGLGYGLASYSNTLSDYTDENWLKNYSKTECAIIVNSNDYARNYALIGNYILFENGEIYRIINVSDDGTSIIILLDANKILSPYSHGDISKAIYCDSNQDQMASIQSEKVNVYKSSYGLQGKVFRYLARYLGGGWGQYKACI